LTAVVRDSLLSLSHPSVFVNHFFIFCLSLSIRIRISLRDSLFRLPHLSMCVNHFFHSVFSFSSLHAVLDLCLDNPLCFMISMVQLSTKQIRIHHIPVTDSYDTTCPFLCQGIFRHFFIFFNHHKMMYFCLLRTTIILQTLSKNSHHFHNKIMIIKECKEFTFSHQF